MSQLRLPFRNWPQWAQKAVLMVGLAFVASVGLPLHLLRYLPVAFSDWSDEVMELGRMLIKGRDRPS